MGIDDKNASWPHRQLNKKSLEFNNEEKNSRYDECSQRYYSIMT
jgi:hypothetical protein